MKIKTIITSILTIAVGFQLSANTLEFSSENSEIHWHGTKVGGEHSGNLTLNSGSIELKSGTITGGSFSIDMTSITNTDIEKAKHSKKLVKHLKSKDFFGVETFPEATLEIIESSEFSNGSAHVKANLTIKDHTHPIAFDVIQEGTNYKATIVVDRSLYDVRYGSGKFFKNLGNKLIHDEFTITVSLMTQ